jgi:hypothetical protein
MARGAGLAGNARRGSGSAGLSGWFGLSRLSGLSGLSCWPDRQTHQANQKNQIDQRNQMNQMNELSAMAGGRYTFSARRWLSGQEREISESGTEEERRNSVAGAHPKSGHRGRGRPHLAKRLSLIRL